MTNDLSGKTILELYDIGCGAAAVADLETNSSCRNKIASLTEQADDQDPLKPVRKVEDIREKDFGEQVGQMGEKHWRDRLLGPIRNMVEGWLENARNDRKMHREADSSELVAIEDGKIGAYKNVLKLIDRDDKPVACPHCGDTSGGPQHFEGCPDRKVPEQVDSTLPILDHDVAAVMVEEPVCPKCDESSVAFRPEGSRLHFHCTQEDCDYEALSEDCPDRPETEAASFTTPGRCDHYEITRGYCILHKTPMLFDNAGHCCASEDCAERQIDGKTRDKGGD